jgi:hypothetical protein
MVAAAQASPMAPAIAGLAEPQDNAEVVCSSVDTGCDLGRSEEAAQALRFAWAEDVRLDVVPRLEVAAHLLRLGSPGFAGMGQ